MDQGAVTSGLVDLSNLPKLIDKIPTPTVYGSDSTSYAFSVDSKYVGTLDFVYSLDGTNFVDFATFFQQNPNLYNKILSLNSPVKVKPIALGTAEFGVLVNTMTISTNGLVSIIDTVDVPSFTSSTDDTEEYGVNANQTGVDYTFSVDKKN